MNSSIKTTTIFSFAVLVCLSCRVASHATKVEPEMANALEVCSSLEQFTDWISDLSGETEGSIRGKACRILTRAATTQGARMAEEYLREQFYALGLEAETHDVPENPQWGDVGDNVIARLPGMTAPEEVVIMCAHYDSQGGPGADVNASGTAGVLTAARILRNFRFDRTVEFCLLAAGENAVHYGSEAYASECLASGKNIVGVLTMDSLVHPLNHTDPSAPVDLDIHTNAASQGLAGLVEQSIEGYAPLDVQVHGDGDANANHGPFWALLPFW